MDNLVDMGRAALKNDAVERMSSTLHESEQGIRQGFEEAVPVSIAGLANQANTEEQARTLLEGFRRGQYPQIDPGDLTRTVSEEGTAERLADASAPFLGQAFGGRLDKVVDGLAGDTGLRRSSASKLLGLAAPLVMGMVSKLVRTRSLDPRGLLGFLGEQRRFAAGALPAGLAGVLGPMMGATTDGGVTAARTVRRAETAAPLAQEGTRRRWWPWLLIPLALLALVLWSASRGRNRGADVSETPAATAPITGQPMPEQLTAGSGLVGLEATLRGGAQLPRRFVLSGLQFRTDSAEIEPSTASILDEVATSLKAHPSATMRVEGHTDATGSAEANLRLSSARANAARDYLAEQGVAASRIEARGAGADQPVASNDTPQGRAQNRRTELVLTGR